MRRLRERPDKHYRGERCTSRLNSHSRPISPECEEGSFLMTGELQEVGVMSAQQGDDGAVWAIPQGNPHHFRRGSQGHAEPQEIFVPRYERAAVVDCKRPYFGVGGAAAPQPAHMKRIRVEIREGWKERLGEVPVQQEAHGG